MFKELWETNKPKLLELLGVIICSLLIGGLTYLMVNTSFGCTVITIIVSFSVIGIIFYYFGGLIRPYINELQEKIIKNINKKSAKKSDKK